MGVNANFVADFSTFLAAINAADVALADFGKGADTVSTKLNNMVDKWSGRALIQQANELVVAIDKVGGVTALTTNEQVKLNATLTEAIAKYHAIGETVPADMQKLADQTKNAKGRTDEWVSTLTDLASAFGIAFSVDAIVKFVEQVVSSAQALQTLSQQTGINIDTLQTLTAATASYGVTGDDLSRALFTLQQRIAGGDQSVVVAYARMGISLDDLRGKNAEELFLTTERALGQLSGATQDLVAKDLYGKLGMSMIAFSKNVDTAMDSVAKIPKVSDEANKALADLGDAAERGKTSFMHWVSEGIGGALVGLDNLHKALDIQGGNQLKVFAAGWQDWFQTLVTGTPHAEHLATVFDELNRKQATDIQLTNEGKNAHKEAGDALVSHADAVKYMDTLQSQSGKALTDWQTTMLDQLKTMNQLDALHAAGIGVTVQQLDKYKAGLEAAKKASEDLAKQQQQADAIALDQYNKRIKQLESIAQANLKAYSFDGQIAQLNNLIAAEEAAARAVYEQLNSEKDRMKVIEDLATKRVAIANQMAAIEQSHAKVVNDQVVAELQAQAQILGAYGQNVDGTLKVENAQTKLQVALDALHAKKQEGVSQYQQEQVLMNQFLKDQEAEIAAVNQSTGAEDAHTEALKKNKQAVADLHGQFTALVTDASIPAFFGNMTGYASVAATVAAGGTHTAGEAAYIAAGGIISGPIGGLSTHRASGGPVDAGSPYMVGENGPEMFVPSQAGNIVPNGGGVNLVVNINSPLGTPDAIARAVGGAFMSVLKSQGTRLPLGSYGSG
jgi:hypothetical protein